MSRKSNPRPQRLRIARAVARSGIRAANALRRLHPAPAASAGSIRTNPRGKRTYRWFCSMGCQAAFTIKAKRGLSMVEFDEEETQALPAVMRALAPEMERIGWDRPLGQLSQNDMHRLIVITIEAEVPN